MWLKAGERAGKRSFPSHCLPRCLSACGLFIIFFPPACLEDSLLAVCEQPELREYKSGWMKIPCSQFFLGLFSAIRKCSFNYRHQG